MDHRVKPGGDEVIIVFLRRERDEEKAC